MRACAVVVLNVVVGALMAGCGSSKGGGGKDAAAMPDGGQDKQAASDSTGDLPGDGRDAAATDARDAAPDSGADAPGDTAQDVAAQDLGAADAVGDTTAGGDAIDAAATDVAAPMPVTVQYSGQVVTVAGTPLGFDSTVRLAPVSGSFTYDLNVQDATPTDPQRGLYRHAGSSRFTFNVSGHVVTGSNSAIVEIEDLPGADTFRFLDGQQNDGATRVMKLDGTDRPALVLTIAITDSSGTALTSDHEPNPFPFTDAGDAGITHVPHTFAIDDGFGNSLLMQLDSMTQQ
jgi:hypothetical protein